MNDHHGEDEFSHPCTRGKENRSQSEVVGPERKWTVSKVAMG